MDLPRSPLKGGVRRHPDQILTLELSWNADRLLNQELSLVALSFSFISAVQKRCPVCHLLHLHSGNRCWDGWCRWFGEMDAPVKDQFCHIVRPSLKWVGREEGLPLLLRNLFNCLEKQRHNGPNLSTSFTCCVHQQTLSWYSTDCLYVLVHYVFLAFYWRFLITFQFIVWLYVLWFVLSELQ